MSAKVLTLEKGLCFSLNLCLPSMHWGIFFDCLRVLYVLFLMLILLPCLVRLTCCLVMSG